MMKAPSSQSSRAPARALGRSAAWDRSSSVPRNPASRSASATGTLTVKINALGQRLEKTSLYGTTRYVYDEQGKLIGEYDENGQVRAEHIWLGDLPIGVAKAGQLYTVITDQLGTPRAVLNLYEQVVWRWDNTDPYGNNLPNENPGGLGTQEYHLGFPGQYRDKETGLSYNYFRDYDPSIGSYIESDPIGLDGGINTFAYVENSPLDGFDPTGLANGGGRGITGGSSGAGTPNKYKHCKLDPNDSNYIICRDKLTGKKIRKPRPPDWPMPKEECGESCKRSLIVVGGLVIAVGACLLAPELLIFGGFAGLATAP